MSYLRQQYRQWWGTMNVPKDLQDHFGKKRFHQKLGTESKTEAERLVLPVIAEWKLQIKIARGENVDGVSERELVSRMSHEKAEDYKEFILGPKAEEIEESHGYEVAKRFLDNASGQRTPTMMFVEQWLTSTGLNARRVDMYRSDLKQLSEHVEFIENLDKKTVKGFVIELLKDLSPRTVRRKMSAYKSYWGWLQDVDLIDEDKADPFNVKLPKANAEDTRPFTEGELEVIFKKLQGGRDTQLKQLTTLALYTGARISDRHTGRLTVLRVASGIGLLLLT